MFENKTTLIFDFDGTLIDSAPDLARSGNLMLETLGKDTFDEPTFRNWIGNGARTMVHRALSGATEVNANLPQAQLEQALETFLEIYTNNLCVETKLYPKVAETLQDLKAKGYRLVIATNKPYAFVQPILDGLQQDGLFELIIGGDTLPTKKPEPGQLFHVAEALGEPIDKCLMIGDSKNDIIAANAAGMDSVGVTWGYNYGEDISEHGPNVVIENFAQMRDLLSA